MSARLLANKARRYLVTKGRRLLAGNWPLVLMYHRVAEVQHDPWHLAVTPERFEHQLRALREVREIVSLADAVASGGRMRGGRPVAAITFDDAYQDVFENGADVLKRLNCPATVFVVSGAVDSAREFWWDELARVLLAPVRLPPSIRFEVNGAARTVRVPDVTDADSRLDLYRQIWELLRDLDDGHRQSVLDSFSSFADRPSDQTDRPASSQVIRNAVDHGLFEIGAHTITHRSLPSLSVDDIRHELAESRRQISQLVGRSVVSMAYPFGDHDDRVIDIARETGYDVACCVHPAPIRQDVDAMRIPRVSIGNWDASAFLRHLNIDPYVASLQVTRRRPSTLTPDTLART